MITIMRPKKDEISKNVIINNIQLTHKIEVFDEARKLFKERLELRNKILPIYSQKGNILYYLKWEKNQIDPIYFVDEFWEYDIYDSHMDYELLNRAEVYLFLTLEEYTYQIARIIKRRYPRKQIFFLDENAKFFFKDTKHFHIINSIADLYNEYKKYISKTILTIDSKKEFLYNDMRFIIKRYRSLSVMTSLFWKRNMISYGSKNPEKIFYIIRDRLGYSGLGDMIKRAFIKVEMAKKKAPNIIPVIDFSVVDDVNQFTNGNGDNAWTLFFEQITNISLEEVYESKNVIVSSHEGWDLFNPYIYEQFCFIDWRNSFRKYLRINDKAREYIELLYEKTISKRKKILGVIGRGTDRYSDRSGTADPMEANIFLCEVKKYFNKWGCDNIFLATEDKYVYEVFMESNLKDKIITVDQERIDYKDKKNKNLLLSEIKIRDHRNGYDDNLMYLGILCILAKCHSLISTCYCGASWCSIGLNDGQYENIKIF